MFSLTTLIGKKQFVDEDSGQQRKDWLMKEKNDHRHTEIHWTGRHSALVRTRGERAWCKNTLYIAYNDSVQSKELRQWQNSNMVIRQLCKNLSTLCMGCKISLETAVTWKPFQKYFTQTWVPNWNSLWRYKYKLQAVLYYCLESSVVCKHKAMYVRIHKMLELLNKCI